MGMTSSEYNLLSLIWLGGIRMPTRLIQTPHSKFVIIRGFKIYFRHFSLARSLSLSSAVGSQVFKDYCRVNLGNGLFCCGRFQKFIFVIFSHPLAFSPLQISLVLWHRTQVEPIFIECLHFSYNCSFIMLFFYPTESGVANFISLTHSNAAHFWGVFSLLVDNSFATFGWAPCKEAYRVKVGGCFLMMVIVSQKLNTFWKQAIKPTYSVLFFGCSAAIQSITITITRFVRSLDGCRRRRRRHQLENGKLCQHISCGSWKRFFGTWNSCDALISTPIPKPSVLFPAHQVFQWYTVFGAENTVTGFVHM